MRHWKIVLPYPPSLNSYYRHARGITYISKYGKAYREQTINIIKKINMDRHITERLSVTIYLAPPDLRKRDIDNCQKCLFDALTHAGFWEDDSQIDKMTVIRCQKVKHGKVVLVIRERDPKLLDIHEVLE